MELSPLLDWQKRYGRYYILLTFLAFVIAATRFPHQTALWTYANHSEKFTVETFRITSAWRGKSRVYVEGTINGRVTQTTDSRLTLPPGTTRGLRNRTIREFPIQVLYAPEFDDDRTFSPYVHILDLSYRGATRRDALVEIVAWNAAWVLAAPPLLVFVIINLIPSLYDSALSLVLRYCDPTRRWPPFDGRPLQLNLKNGTLNAVKIGQPFEQLAWLGPADAQPWIHGHEFRYYRRGLCVEVNKHTSCIDGFYVVVSDPSKAKYESYRGRVSIGSQDVELASLTFQNCADVLGASHRLPQEDDRTVSYAFEHLEWDVEFDADSRLERLYISRRENTPPPGGGQKLPLESCSTFC